MNLVIWDIDNCLADDAWRIAFIEHDAPTPSERYRKYHALCGFDKPGNQHEFRTSTMQGEVPLFITGRPESERAKTAIWLRTHIDPDRAPLLLMRGNGDERPSVDVKLALLTAELQRMSLLRPRVVRAYDDRHDILQMYRDMFDIDARHLAIHSIDAYSRGGVTA